MWAGNGELHADPTGFQFRDIWHDWPDPSSYSELAIKSSVVEKRQLTMMGMREERKEKEMAG